MTQSTKSTISKYILELINTKKDFKLKEIIEAENLKNVNFIDIEKSLNALTKSGKILTKYKISSNHGKYLAEYTYFEQIPKQMNDENGNVFDLGLSNIDVIFYKPVSQKLDIDEFLEDLKDNLVKIKVDSTLDDIEIAKRIGHSSTGTVRRMVRKVQNFSVISLFRYAKVCGFNLKISFEKIKEEHDSEKISVISIGE